MDEGYVAVRDEPRHRRRFEDDHVRVYDVLIPPGDTTLSFAHFKMSSMEGEAAPHVVVFSHPSIFAAGKDMGASCSNGQRTRAGPA